MQLNQLYDGFEHNFLNELKRLCDEILLVIGDEVVNEEPASTQTARILSYASNSSVVQMSGRKFPGIVMQGDTVAHLFEQVCFAMQNAKQHQDEEAYYEFLTVAELLQGQLLHYEETLDRLGLSRPYAPSIRGRFIQDDYEM